MILTLRSMRFLFAFVLSAAAAAALAAQPAGEAFKPYSGQPGKDVVWVPTSDALVEKMLDLAKVTAADRVIDLGSGDGRTVIAAAKRGAVAHGIEYNPDMVALSKENAAKAGISDRATFAKADLFESDFSKATVITMFLLPDINLKLRPKLLDMKPGTRLVSNTFTMGEWQADETATVTDPDASYWRTALLWIVPAKAEGAWQLADRTLVLKQQFQMLSGSLRGKDGSESVVADGRLRGEEIHFKAGGVEYTGRVSGNEMSGTWSANGKSGSWRATRAGANG